MVPSRAHGATARGNSREYNLSLLRLPGVAGKHDADWGHVTADQRDAAPVVVVARSGGPQRRQGIPGAAGSSCLAQTHG